MKTTIHLEIYSQYRLMLFAGDIEIPENITGQELVEQVRKTVPKMGDSEYVALVEWTTQQAQEKLLSPNGKVVLLEKPLEKETAHLIHMDPESELIDLDAAMQRYLEQQKRSGRLSGDSSTDAPPPGDKPKPGGA